MAKILITGGAGFIGSFVAKALVEAGEEVVLLDNFDDFLYPATFKQARIEHLFKKEKRPQVVTGDILDGKLLGDVFTDGQFNAVLHFAALANPGRSMTEAGPYTLVNVNGTVNVLEAVSQHEVPHLIVAGSSSVYDDTQTPFKEDSYPLRPHSPYGASKAAMETYVQLWHEMHGIPTTIFRFFSVYGPWGRPDMAPMIFTDSVMNEKKLELSTDRQRDFTYIDDIVSGLMLGLERTLEFEIINLGRGEPHPIEDFVQSIEKAAGKKAIVTSREAPAGEMRVTYADISKAKKLFGYAPKVSVDEGAAKLVDWYKQYGSLVAR
ncbi:MAG: GDP-mannose 4,6-dehydratase [Candidatus Andersenbacteria bacterium]|nr:GDP-mannose 4,6-dehydratase [Candidatus Andersenbacteria bacterium]MBI3251086.1 GDP-mannose 4,6-dehydratase [Candidatus Andersenbacteria bacterium]